ncbi:MAG: ABC transporter permease subunit [Thermoanaerobaculia bacterium]|nr:ABC transporter permease subunit [Thermoanaerobaculia bacterium]
MRRAFDRLCGVVFGLAALVSLAILVGVVSYLLWRALPVLDVAFISSPMAKAGAAGGVRYQLLGTLLLSLSALTVAVPLAIALALAIAGYGRDHRAAEVLETALYVVNGIPSILFGVFAFVLFGQTLGWGKSWLAGGIVLGLMAVPMITLSTVERMRALPRDYPETARALGLSQSQALLRVVLPMSRDGLVSGSLLGVARAAGETAPILFAAVVFSGATLPTAIVDSPVTALPYHIFVLAQDTFDPQARLRLWGAAWVLLGVTLSCSLLSLPIRWRHAASAEVQHD